MAGVLLETQPQGGQAVEGKMLVLVCSVAEGTGETTFSWHRVDTKERLGSKSLRSRRSELKIPNVRESHAGGYYCAAHNTGSLIHSEVLNVTVKSEYRCHQQPAASRGPVPWAAVGCPWGDQEQGQEEAESPRGLSWRWWWRRRWEQQHSQRS